MTPEQDLPFFAYKLHRQAIRAGWQPAVICNIRGLDCEYFAHPMLDEAMHWLRTDAEGRWLALEPDPIEYFRAYLFAFEYLSDAITLRLMFDIKAVIIPRLKSAMAPACKP